MAVGTRPCGASFTAAVGLTACGKYLFFARTGSPQSDARSQSDIGGDSEGFFARVLD